MSLTLELSEREAAVLSDLAAQQEMSKAQIMRQALRLYQYIVVKQQTGHEMAFIKNGEAVRQEIVGLPLPE